MTPPETANAGCVEAKAEAVNSASHRAAHARLTRRMASSGADFPHMFRLWSGNRKDMGDTNRFSFTHVSLSSYNLCRFCF